MFSYFLQKIFLLFADDDGDYVVFSSDDELKVAINSVTDNTLRIYIRGEKFFSNKLKIFIKVKRSSKMDSKMIKVLPEKEILHPSTSSSHPPIGSYPPVGSYPPLGSYPPIGSNQAISSNPIPIYSQVARRTDSYGYPGYSSSSGAKSSPFVHRPHHRSTTHLEPRPSSPIKNSLEEPLLNLNLNEHPEGPMVNHVGPPSGGSGGPGGPGILCSECQGEGRGVFYSCTICKNYFLCSDCENRGLHDQHIMVRVTSAR